MQILFRKNPEHVHIGLLCSSHEDLIHDSVVNLSFSVLTLGSNVKTVIQEKDTQLFFFLILLTGKGWAKEKKLKEPFPIPALLPGR